MHSVSTYGGSDFWRSLRILGGLSTCLRCWLKLMLKVFDSAT